ncbi:hypothetical protein BTUL_0169g00010 [Botrytis tulipae]|uniref:Uncharacterized protein n=1 Tax=Botrytis tulipae TaxID=87230 RepID=A0A4Z1EFT2_9HELO|nr:hypothetical protein BTUL_0169g00010 [Botrytis tulipae]
MPSSDNIVQVRVGHRLEKCPALQPVFAYAITGCSSTSPVALAKTNISFHTKCTIKSLGSTGATIGSISIPVGIINLLN